jgi:hypothetical protein
MKMNEETSVIPAELWEEYEALQRKIRRVKKIDSYAWALEEQLDCFLIPKQLPADSEDRSRVLQNFLLNRIKKHSRRNKLLEEQYRPSAGECFSEGAAIHSLHVKETIASVRAASSKTEWRILAGLAQGKSYDAVAEHERISISALKSKVCRCRRRFKAIAA